MVDNGVAIDPTLAIHEYLLLARNGETREGVLDYVDHMPANFQRGAKVALSDVSTPEDDDAYRGAFDQIVATVKMMKDRGVFIVLGTDLGGAFNLHRELELYQDVGFTPAEILKRATLDVADYMGHADERGSIEDGKLADFFLVPGDPTADLKAIKTISLVSRGGVFYYPSEIYPKIGSSGAARQKRVMEERNFRSSGELKISWALKRGRPPSSRWPRTAPIASRRREPSTE